MHAEIVTRAPFVPGSISKNFKHAVSEPRFIILAVNRRGPFFPDGYIERKHSPPVTTEGMASNLKETKAPFRDMFRRFARHAFPLCSKKASVSNGIRGKRLFSTVLIFTREGFHLYRKSMGYNYTPSWSRYISFLGIYEHPASEPPILLETLSPPTPILSSATSLKVTPQ